jgi:hypothetical protein
LGAGSLWFVECGGGFVAFKLAREDTAVASSAVVAAVAAVALVVVMALAELGKLEELLEEEEEVEEEEEEEEEEEPVELEAGGTDNLCGTFAFARVGFFPSMILLAVLFFRGGDSDSNEAAAVLFIVWLALLPACVASTWLGSRSNGGTVFGTGKGLRSSAKKLIEFGKV